MRSMVYTMPEFLERRFNPQSRRLLTIIQLFSFVIAKASVTIFAGALVFNQFLGVDFWSGAIILVIVTGVYTVLGGLIAYALHSQGKLQLTDTNAAFPEMVKQIMPMGLRGLLAGGLLAALMSSLASVYNACSTLFTIDIYKKQHPEASEKKLVRVGRIATACIVLLGMAWIPLMEKLSKSSLYDYLQSVQSYLAPPIAAVFLLGVFFKRLNAKGAYSAMVAGFIVGLLKLTLQIFEDKLPVGGILYQFATINFLYFCIYLFLFSITVMVVVSLFTPKPSAEQINGLTFATTVAEDRAASRASWNKMDVILSLIIVAIIVSIFIYFSPLGIAK